VWITYWTESEKSAVLGAAGVTVITKTAFVPSIHV